MVPCLWKQCLIAHIILLQNVDHIYIYRLYWICFFICSCLNELCCFFLESNIGDRTTTRIQWNVEQITTNEDTSRIFIHQQARYHLMNILYRMNNIVMLIAYAQYLSLIVLSVGFACFCMDNVLLRFLSFSRVHNKIICNLMYQISLKCL